MIKITNEQARKFMLLRHGLLGEYSYSGKEGVFNFFQKVRCVQFDPVDVVGRNADICLHSRVKDYTKKMLDELLYMDRSLIDYFDKNLSIVPIEDFPALLQTMFESSYVKNYERHFENKVKDIYPLVRNQVEIHGYVKASDIKEGEPINGYWGIKTSLSRIALESMYLRGELIVHHKNRTNKSYAFAKDHIPKEILNKIPEYMSKEERNAMYVKRRIAAVGLLWNRASDAWLGCQIKAEERQRAFQKLLEAEEICEIAVEGIRDTLYILYDEIPILTNVLQQKEFKPRTEFIAPLDSIMWDRKLIKTLFDFEFTWEIYTPVEKRKYGAYVLPILHGDRFVGRIEVVRERKTQTLKVRNIWYEDGIKKSKKLQGLVEKCLLRFAKFNECPFISYD